MRTTIGELKQFILNEVRPKKRSLKAPVPGDEVKLVVDAIKGALEERRRLNKDGNYRSDSNFFMLVVNTLKEHEKQLGYSPKNFEEYASKLANSVVGLLQPMAGEFRKYSTNKGRIDWEEISSFDMTLASLVRDYLRTRRLGDDAPLHRAMNAFYTGETWEIGSPEFHDENVTSYFVPTSELEPRELELCGEIIDFCLSVWKLASRFEIIEGEIEVDRDDPGTGGRNDISSGPFKPRFAELVSEFKKKFGIADAAKAANALELAVSGIKAMGLTKARNFDERDETVSDFIYGSAMCVLRARNA